MNLILFLIIVAIIYFIATQIKVVHINTLPDEQKTELYHRSRIKNMLTTNYIKTSKNDRTNTPCLPDALALIKMIKKYHLNNQYKFNIAGLPVTTRSPNKNTLHKDKKYIKQITKNINSWNNFLQVKEIRPLYIAETDNEFIVKANSDIIYSNKHIFMRLTYYGHIEKTDDPFNQDDTYILQLVELKPIIRSEYESTHEIHQPFMTMTEQMDYVNKINKMHEEELNNIL